MRDAKSLFDDLKRRIEPFRSRPTLPADTGSASVVPVAEPERSVSPEPAADNESPASETVSTHPATDSSEPAEAAAPDHAAADQTGISAGEAGSAGAETDSATVAETGSASAAAPGPAPETPVPEADDGARPPALIAEAIRELAAARQLQPPAMPPEEAFEAMAREIETLVTEIDTRGEKPAADMDAPATDSAVPEAGNLLANVRKIAAGWFRNGRRRDAVNAGAADLATPEELTTAAAERGVDVRYVEKPIKSLTEKDFPCVALEKDGGSRILLGRPDGRTFLTDVNGRATAIGRKALEAVSAGVVFLVKPRPPTEIERPGTRRDRPVKRGGVFGIMGIVAGEMLHAHRPLLFQLVLATVVSNLFTLALPLFSMAVYDRVVPHLAWETLWALSIGVGIILVLDFALRYIRLKLVDAVGLSMATTLQARLYSRVIHGRMKDAPSASGGLASGFREVEALCHVVPMLAVSVLVDLPFFVAASFLIYSIGGMVALTPFIGAFALALVHVASHLGEDAARKHSRYTGTQSNVLVETVGSLETLKIHGAERMLLRRWERLVDASSHASHLNRLQGGFSGQASVVISQGVTVLALIIGVYEISVGAMTVGALTACTLLIGRLMTPVSQLMGLFHRTHQLASAAEMMQRILAMPAETAGDSSEIREEQPIRGEVIFNGVSFTYPGEETPVLSDISLTIRPGEKIGLIGRVGSGKSTLLRLMLRLHDATGGTVLLDGQDIRQISPRAIRRHFGFMRQDSALLDDTLQANLIYGMPAIEPGAFETAVALSGVKDFASRHPQGYGLRVGPRGERLSGGERQSVGLARLIAETTPAMLLDEPTAAMDNALEARIVRDLRDFVGGRTVLVATHRAPLLGLVDRIIWLEGGRIIADGPKDEVLRRISQPAA